MKTVFHLVRHADHGQVGQVLTGRMPGIRLSATGRAEAVALARRIAGTPMDALCSSPQLRARETAEFIASAVGLEARIAPELDEIDFGRWAGQRFEALECDPEWTRWNVDRNTARTPAGETMNDVAVRVGKLFDRLRHAFPGGSVCLVSHGDVIKSTLCRYLGKAFHEVHQFEIAPASVTTIALDDSGATVLAVNRRTGVECEEMIH